MQSLASQSEKDFEHLIIDGASTDDTLAVARSFPGLTPRIISEPDKGLYDAMNKGLRMATGDYVLFLNAGDAFHDADCLARYAQAAASGDYDIIYGDTAIVDDHRRFLAPRHLSAPERLTVRSFSHGMLICHQAFMVRRSLAPEYDTAYRFSADYDWTVRCIKKTSSDRCHNLHAITIDYLSDGTTDHNKLASLRERFRIMGRHYGMPLTLMRHAAFVPRAIARKLRGKSSGSAAK